MDEYKESKLLQSLAKLLDYQLRNTNDMTEQNLILDILSVLEKEKIYPNTNDALAAPTGNWVEMRILQKKNKTEINRGKL